MKRWVASIFLFLFLACGQALSQSLYWEDISRQKQQEIIELLDPHLVLRAYYGRVTPLADDDFTEELLQEILAPDLSEGMRALKFHLLNRICREADGAAAEVVSSVVTRYLYQQPDYVLSYLKDHPDLAEQYQMYVATELDFIAHRVSDVTITEKGFLNRIRRNTRDKVYVTSFLKEVQNMRDGDGT
jgi:hypothetical protein